MSVDNLSPWPYAAFPSYDRDGRDVLVVVVGATFEIPKAPGQPLCPSAVQHPVPLEDRYAAEPGTSGLIQIAQTAYTRPGADIYVRGTIRSRAPTTALEVLLQIADLHLATWVVGDRHWTRTLTGWRATEPELFDAMPLAWERCHGGPLEPRNLVGCHPPTDLAEGYALPNFEAFGASTQSPDDRREPIGFGPIPPQWQPRLGHAGTYDELWQHERAPYWPEDLDPRFFHAAPARLRREYLRGGEPVTLAGFLPGAPRRFELPRLRLQLKWCSRGITRRELLRVDGLEFDLDHECFTLYARHSLDLDEGLGRRDVATLRMLQDWEDDP